jgi:hypothetical protein
MSVFYQSKSIIPAASKVLEEALALDPKAITDRGQKAIEMANQVKDQVTRGFAWGHFGAAILFLVLLFFGGIYTAQHTGLEAWSTVLLHTFEVALGGVVGIVIGERSAKP